jgi:hypothetical protein
LIFGLILLVVGSISFYVVSTSTESQLVEKAHIPVNVELTSENFYTAMWDLNPPDPNFRLLIRLACSNFSEANVMAFSSQGEPSFHMDTHFYVYKWTEEQFCNLIENTLYYHVEVKHGVSQVTETIQVYGDFYFVDWETKPVFVQSGLTTLIALGGVAFLGVAMIFVFIISAKK